MESLLRLSAHWLYDPTHQTVSLFLSQCANWTNLYCPTVRAERTELKRTEASLQCARREQNNITRAVEVSYYPLLVTKEISLKLLLQPGRRTAIWLQLWQIHSLNTGNKERIKWNSLLESERITHTHIYTYTYTAGKNFVCFWVVEKRGAIWPLCQGDRIFWLVYVYVIYWWDIDVSWIPFIQVKCFSFFLFFFSRKRRGKKFLYQSTKRCKWCGWLCGCLSVCVTPGVYLCSSSSQFLSFVSVCMSVECLSVLLYLVREREKERERERVSE